MTHDKPDVIVMRACALAFIAMILIACAPMKPCDPERLNCDNGTRSTGGAVSRPAAKPTGPSESNNPGRPASGGQVGSPGKGGHKGHGNSKGKK